MERRRIDGAAFFTGREQSAGSKQRRGIPTTNQRSGKRESETGGIVKEMRGCVIRGLRRRVDTRETRERKEGGKRKGR